MGMWGRGKLRTQGELSCSPGTIRRQERRLPCPSVRFRVYWHIHYYLELPFRATIQRRLTHTLCRPHTCTHAHTHECARARTHTPTHSLTLSISRTHEDARAHTHTRVAGVTLPLVPQEGSNRHVRKWSDIFGIEYAIVARGDGPQRMRPEDIQGLIGWGGEEEAV